MPTLEEKHTIEYGTLVTQQENKQIEQLNKQYLEIKQAGTQTPEMAERYNKENLALKKVHALELRELRIKQEKEKGPDGPNYTR